MMDVDSDAIELQWNITEKSSDSITIQLIFSNPEWVSTFRNDKDKIEMKFLKPELFEGATSRKKLDKNKLKVVT